MRKKIDFAVIGLRRREQTRKKIGKIIFEMVENNISQIQLKDIIKNYNIDPRTLESNFGSLKYMNGKRYFYISDEIREELKELIEIYKKMDNIENGKEKYFLNKFLQWQHN